MPKEVRFRTRHELALEMLDERGAALPHAWVAGDDEMGRPSGFRRELRGRGERYLLAVPSNTLVRDLDAPPPEYAGRGRHPKNPFVRLDRWRAALPEAAWTTIEVRDGEKGPLVDRGREASGAGADGDRRARGRRSCCSSRGSGRRTARSSMTTICRTPIPETPLTELARVAKAAHRVEECFKRAKGEAGLADYQVRNWVAWHHHQTLSLLAAWFLNQETRRGKNPDPRADVAAAAAADRRA